MTTITDAGRVAVEKVTAVLNERRGWHRFSDTHWHTTDPDQRFTILLDPCTFDGTVDVSVYDTTVRAVPEGAPVVNFQTAVTPTGNLAAATMAALLAHLEGLIEA